MAKLYEVCFREHRCGEVHHVIVWAKNKEDAYDKATYETIPTQLKIVPYSTWVQSAIQSSGKVIMFNTHEGMPY